MTEEPGFLATGNINPSRFVTLTSGSNFGCNQSTTADLPIGISQVGTHDAPGLSGSTAFAAIAGQQLQVFTNADVCLLETGSAWNVGMPLKPDATGRGVPATVGDYYGAIALEQSTTTGEFRRVKVQPGKF